MYHIFFNHSSVDGHLHCFQVLAIVNSVARDTGVRVPFWAMFVSQYMARNGIAGSYGSSKKMYQNIFYEESSSERLQDWYYKSESCFRSWQCFLWYYQLLDWLCGRYNTHLWHQMDANFQVRLVVEQDILRLVLSTWDSTGSKDSATLLSLPFSLLGLPRWH